MISLVRIDDRLIHGQVATVWSKYLGVDRIIVANDNVVKDETQMMALSMAVPSNIKAIFRNIDDVIRLLNDPRSEKLKILVLVASPKDALRLVEKVSEITEVNVGNFGRINNTSSVAKEQLYSNVFASEEEKKDFDDLKLAVDSLYVQTVPTVPKEIY